MTDGGENTAAAREHAHGEHKEVFRAGSTTYFNSSLFFPPRVRERVFTLYAFVRVADNYVDAVPQQAAEFRNFRRRYEAALAGKPAGDTIIDPFLKLSAGCGFDPAWTAAFLDSMEADLSKQDYDTLEETLAYVYGSAEVIGFFMARIMDLPEESYPAAAMLGRAMQYINFIRDIAEDASLGRRYLPLHGASPGIVTAAYARQNPGEFSAFIGGHLAHYRLWQKEAIAGYAYIPRRYRVPIKTAADMYWWTARCIQRRPLVVFDQKVKPSRGRVYLRIARNAVFC
jgi:phytoene synthase